MGTRSTASGSLSFGMVSLPVKLYTSAVGQGVKFNLLTTDGHKVKQQYIDANTGNVVEYKDLLKGYEYQKGQYVRFSPEELKALESEKSDIQILEFVPFNAVDFVYVDKSYYIGLDEKFGGDKAFQLLLQAMKAKDVVAIGSYVNRGKEHLIMIRPYQDGLILHHLFYANEVREYDAKCKQHEFSDKELGMANQLIEQLSSDEFEPSKYEDNYSKRILEVVEKKVAGEDVTITINAEKKNANDLFAALEASLKGPVKKIPQRATVEKKTAAKKSATKRKAS